MNDDTRHPRQRDPRLAKMKPVGELDQQIKTGFVGLNKERVCA